MPASPSHRRTSTLAAVLAVLALTASSCGGDDADATDKPSQTVTSSATPSATPTPTQTPRAEPLSPFEDKAPVKAARAWAVVKNQAINAGDDSLAALRPLTTQRGLDVTRKVATGDLEHHYYLPGPDPFTPVSVRINGNRATLNLCMLNLGWSVDRKTNKPVGKHEVGPVLFEMVRQDGDWKFDNGYQGTGDCSGVKVAEVTW